MEESSTPEFTSDELRDLTPIPEELSSFSQNSTENLTLFDDNFIIFPIISDELSSEQTEKEDQSRYYVDKSKNSELENKNKIENKNSSNFGSNSSFRPSTIPKKAKCEIKKIPINKTKQNYERNISSSFSNPKNLFKTLKTSVIDSGRKLLGRKKKNTIINDNKKMHDKYYEDNITIKVQGKAMNSMIQYVNDIIRVLDLGLEHIPVFNKIDYLFRKKISKDAFEENKQKTIENLIEINISPKYSNFPSDYNKKEYEKIKNNETVKNILSQKYIVFFKEVFYQNKRTIDLSKYGCKKTIQLSNKVKLYEDMFKGKNEDEKYKSRVEEVIKKKFLI